MKEHIRKDNAMIKCHYCDFITNDETVFMVHIGDTHSPQFTCDVCGEVFTEMSKKIEHVMVIHAFNYTQQEKRINAYECFDCAEKFESKLDMMAHKKEKHLKTRLCSYFHGQTSTCRFPAQQCINIHNENIHPTQTESDYRSRILCKHGNSCYYRERPGGCFYKHAPNVGMQQNVWQQRSVTRRNTESEQSDVQNVERNQHTAVNNANTPEINMNQVVLNLSKQMEMISQKLQVLEFKSQQDFPTVEQSQRRN